MRTRSRQSLGGDGKPAEEEEAPVSLPPKSPRSSRKRRTPDTSATSTPPPAASETKKSKGVVAAPAAAVATAAAAAVTTPPPKSGKGKVANLEELPKNASRSGKKKQQEAAPPAVVVAKAVEDQSLAQGAGKDQDSTAAKKAPAGGMGVAPKGRCVSGRVWKARNQSQRWVSVACPGRSVLSL